jgi:tetratricopeptide (TPR) repeat protein
MDHTGEVDQDAVRRARTMLLGSARPSVRQQVEAYRVLSAVSPLTYLPKLTRALLSYGYAPEVRDRPEARLARHAEAAATARRIDSGEPNRTELLVSALSAYRYELYAAGRRAEGLAICEEMAEAGRWGFTHGQVPSPGYGHWQLATVLAEDGNHQEAAELCGQLVRATRSEGSARVDFWTMLAWTAELDAAGCHDTALAAFADIVDVSRAEVDEGNSALAILTWQLVHQAGLLDAVGRRVEAVRARQDALARLSELDRTGERKSWSNILSWWTTLYALSGRRTEPAASAGAPAPAFGFPFHDWSPDIKRAYFDSLPALEEQVAGLREAARTDPCEHLPALVALHQRLTVRSALYRENRSYRILKPLRPIFDENVALARRWADTAATEQSREALGQALTGRSMFLLAAHQYGEAYDGYREVVDLLG